MHNRVAEATKAGTPSSRRTTSGHAPRSLSQSRCPSNIPGTWGVCISLLQVVQLVQRGGRRTGRDRPQPHAPSPLLRAAQDSRSAALPAPPKPQQVPPMQATRRASAPVRLGKPVGTLRRHQLPARGLSTAHGPCRNPPSLGRHQPALTYTARLPRGCRGRQAAQTGHCRVHSPGHGSAIQAPSHSAQAP